LQTSTK